MSLFLRSAPLQTVRMNDKGQEKYTESGKTYE
jgi:hypothetical protein